MKGVEGVLLFQLCNRSHFSTLPVHIMSKRKRQAFRAVVFNRGGGEPLCALQHGMFDKEINQQIHFLPQLFSLSGGLDAKDNTRRERVRKKVKKHGLETKLTSQTKLRSITSPLRHNHLVASVMLTPERNGVHRRPLVGDRLKGESLIGREHAVQVLDRPGSPGVHRPSIFVRAFAVLGKTLQLRYH